MIGESQTPMALDMVKILLGGFVGGLIAHWFALMREGKARKRRFIGPSVTRSMPGCNPLNKDDTNNMNARTKCLFHFTDTLDILQSILKDGAFWPQYCLEDIAWLNGPSVRLAWPMVCFCDIPITRLQEHTTFYGSYGIGLRRDPSISSLVSPVAYVTEVDSNFKDALREIQKKGEESKDPVFMTKVALFLAHCKPTRGLCLVNGAEIQRDFYCECEWRYVPWVQSGEGMKYGFTLPEENYKNVHDRTEANKERREDMLRFEPVDVKYLLVKSLEDVPKLTTFINCELGGKGIRYGSDVLDVLKTRILILDEIGDDY
jgi:hypothetical protein